MKKLRRIVSGVAAVVATAALTGCGLQAATAYIPSFSPGSISPSEETEGVPLTIVTKNFTEQLLLGKISVIAATAAGYSVTDLSNVPGSQPARQLMLSGQADVGWEYTGTAWLTYLGNEEAYADQQKQWREVRDADLENGLTWLDPAPLNNTYAFATPRALSEELGVTKLSEIRDLPVDERTFCVEAEFNSRADGFSPMLQAYDLPRDSAEGVPSDNIRVMDIGAIYAATADGACAFGEVFTTDGRIPALDLLVLEDDRDFFPAYNGAPVVNTETLEAHPELAELFNEFVPLLTDETMQELNAQVDVEGREPADVALEWMDEQGFVTAD